MELVVAKTAGFCFGVNRAVTMANEEVERTNGKKIYSLGPIIHNKQVSENFEKKGLKVINDISEIKEGDVLIIRAHGVPENIYRAAQEKGITIVDATCPFVKKIHSKVSEHSAKGYKTIIVGDKNHPEVIGIKGWDQDAIVIGEEIEAEKLDLEGQVCVVAQTTITKDKWDNTCRIISDKIPKCEFFNTICNATSERQEEAKGISKRVDVMLVIGDPNSSNSQKLYEICKKHCARTYFIENAEQIDKNWFISQKTENFQKQAVQGKRERGNGAYIEYVSTAATEETQQCEAYQNFRVGITAGASVPEHIIKEVINIMAENEKQNGEEMSFEELFEGSIKRIEPEEVLKGKVIRVSNNEVFVDLGYKADGIIPKEEFSDNTEEIPSEIYKAGDEIDVYVIKVNDGDGNVLLSRKRIEYLKGWDKIEEAYKSGEFVKGIVNEVVNGGVIAVVTGIRVFIPMSQFSDKPGQDLLQYIKKPVMLKLIDFNKERKKVVGSRRAFLLKEREENKKKCWDTIGVGQTVKGIVKRLTDFGAFVDIGGIDGLIHVSELSWGKIKHPSEIVREGQEVEVRIIDMDKEKDKVSLSYKKTLDDPWETGIKSYQVGDVVKGKVVNMMPFGAFVEFALGLTGLVHISQISNKRIGKPQEVLEINQEVEAKITEINLENKKISLSIKELLPAIEIETKKTEASSKNNEDEEIPSEHKEEMNLTLGDLLNKASDSTAVIKKETSAIEKVSGKKALEKVSDKKAIEKVEEKPLVIVDNKADKKEE
ncbi:MAG: bifunctional 4-hydroxy-3-methylbut-2-enyl diphosphate reductase/30S ribosomal protein S1 [Ignavibacteriales bacterium]